jgi:hypothetical protein
LLSVHAGEETMLINTFEVNPSPVLGALKDKVLYVHGAEFDLPCLFHHYGFEPPRTSSTPFTSLRWRELGSGKGRRTAGGNGRGIP